MKLATSTKLANKLSSKIYKHNWVSKRAKEKPVQDATMICQKKKIAWTTSRKSLTISTVNMSLLIDKFTKGYLNWALIKELTKADQENVSTSKLIIKNEEKVKFLKFTTKILTTQNFSHQTSIAALSGWFLAMTNVSSSWLRQNSWKIRKRNISTQIAVFKVLPKRPKVTSRKSADLTFW